MCSRLTCFIITNKTTWRIHVYVTQLQRRDGPKFVSHTHTHTHTRYHSQVSAHILSHVWPYPLTNKKKHVCQIWINLNFDAKDAVGPDHLTHLHFTSQNEEQSHPPIKPCLWRDPSAKCSNHWAFPLSEQRNVSYCLLTVQGPRIEDSSPFFCQTSTDSSL